MPRPEVGPEGWQALTIWREMGFQLDYSALPWLIERHGIQDAEALVDLLLVIRDTRSTVQ